MLPSSIKLKIVNKKIEKMKSFLFNKLNNGDEQNVLMLRKRITNWQRLV